MTGTRRKAREIALQVLYMMDVGDRSRQEAYELYCRQFEPRRKSLPYAVEVLEGVEVNRERIDETIRAAAQNWRLERMAAIDRNILRIAVYELVCRDDVPDRVGINEAIEIAKRFGTGESVPFINGILDAVQKGGVARSPESPD